MTKLAYALLAGTALVLTALGCTKEVFFESDDLVNQDRFRDTTLVAIESNWANRGKAASQTYTSRRLVVANATGVVDDSYMLARSFLWFRNLPDTTARIDSAYLYLYVTNLSCRGNCSEIGVYALTDTLRQTEVAWDTSPAFEAEPFISFTIANSLDSIFLDVKDLVDDWVHGKKPNLGIALVGNEVPGAYDYIVEFGSREALITTKVSGGDTLVLDLRPSLRITYVDIADTSGEVKFYQSTPSADIFIDTLIAPCYTCVDKSRLVCGNGTPSRAFVRFDLASIPIDATILKATLSVSVDFEQSRFDSMELICHAVVDSQWTHFSSPIGAMGTGKILVQSSDPQDVLTFDVTPLMHRVIARSVPNYGIVIKSTGEEGDLDFIKIFPVDPADEAKAPRLELYYMLPPPPPLREDGP
ncbi:MAG: DNRLRE domain-containing protein [bacterium]